MRTASRLGGGFTELTQRLAAWGDAQPRVHEFQHAA